MGPKKSTVACDKAKKLIDDYLTTHKCAAANRTVSGGHVFYYDCYANYTEGEVNNLDQLARARVKDFLVVDYYGETEAVAASLAGLQGYGDDYGWGGREKCAGPACSKGVGVLDGTYFEWNIVSAGPRYSLDGRGFSSYGLGYATHPSLSTIRSAKYPGYTDNGPREYSYRYYFPDYCFVLENWDLYTVGLGMASWESIHETYGDRFNCTKKQKYADVEWPIPTYSEGASASFVRTGEPLAGEDKKWKMVDNCEGRGPYSRTQTLDYDDDEHYVEKRTYIDFWGRFTMSVDVKGRVGKVKLSKGIGNKLSVGAMIGIVVAVAVVLTVIGLLILYFACVSK